MAELNNFLDQYRQSMAGGSAPPGGDDAAPLDTSRITQGVDARLAKEQVDQRKGYQKAMTDAKANQLKHVKSLGYTPVYDENGNMDVERNADGEPLVRKFNSEHRISPSGSVYDPDYQNPGKFTKNTTVAPDKRGHLVDALNRVVGIDPDVQKKKDTLDTISQARAYLDKEHGELLGQQDNFPTPKAANQAYQSANTKLKKATDDYAAAKTADPDFQTNEPKWKQQITDAQAKAEKAKGAIAPATDFKNKLVANRSAYAQSTEHAARARAGTLNDTDLAGYQKILQNRNVADEGADVSDADLKAAQESQDKPSPADLTRGDLYNAPKSNADLAKDFGVPTVDRPADVEFPAQQTPAPAAVEQPQEAPQPEPEQQPVAPPAAEPAPPVAAPVPTPVAAPAPPPVAPPVPKPDAPAIPPTPPAPPIPATASAPLPNASVAAPTGTNPASTGQQAVQSAKAGAPADPNAIPTLTAKPPPAKPTTPVAVTPPMAPPAPTPVGGVQPVAAAPVVPPPQVVAHPDDVEDMDTGAANSLLSQSGASLASRDADIAQRQQALQAPFQALEAKKANLDQTNAAAIQMGNPTVQMNYVDGTPAPLIAAHLKDQYQDYYLQQQDLATKLKPQTDALNQDLGVLNDDKASHNAAISTVQGKQAAEDKMREDTRQADLAKMRSVPQTAPFADKFDALHNETSQGVKDIAAKYPEGPAREAALDALQKQQQDKNAAIQSNLEDATDPVKRVNHEQYISDFVSLLPTGSNARKEAAAQLKMTPEEIDATVKKVNDRAYSFDENGGLQFAPHNTEGVPTPDEALKGVQQAEIDGMLDPEATPKIRAELETARQSYDELVKAAGSAAPVKAVLRGAGKGGAFLTGSIPGARLGAAAGAMVPGAGETGISEAVGATLGALATGTAASWGYDETLKKLGGYFDAVKSVNAAAELNPGYAQAGELASFAAAPTKILSKAAWGEGAAEALKPAVVRSIQNYKNLANVAADSVGNAGESAAVDAARSAAGMNAVLKTTGGAATGAALFTAGQYAFDAGRYALADTMGIGHEQLKAPGLSDLATNTGLALLLHGQGLAFKDYSQADVASIMSRAQMHKEAGRGYGVAGDPADILKAYEDAGVDTSRWSEAQKAEMTKPLSPEEIAVYKNAEKKTQALRDQGATSAEFKGARQVNIPGAFGKDTPIASAAVEGGKGEGPRGGGLPLSPVGPDIKTAASAAELESNADHPDIGAASVLHDMTGPDVESVDDLSETELRQVGLTRQGTQGTEKIAPYKPMGEDGKRLPAMTPLVHVGEDGKMVATPEGLSLLKANFPATHELVSGHNQTVEADRLSPTEAPTTSTPREASPQAGASVAESTEGKAKGGGEASPAVATPDISKKAEALKVAADHLEATGKTHNVGPLRTEAEKLAAKAPTKQVEPPTKTSTSPTTATKGGDGVRQWAKEKFASLTSEQKSSPTHFQAGKLKLVADALDEYGPSFHGIETGPTVGSAGMEYQPDTGKLHIDPEKFVAHLNASKDTSAVAVKKRIADILFEEKEHRLSTLLDNGPDGKPTATTNPQFAADLDAMWKAVPQKVKDDQRRAYYKNDTDKFPSDWHAKHEWWADTRAAFERGEIPHDLQDPGLLPKIRAVIQSYLKALKEWLAKAPAELKERFQRSIDALKALEARLAKGEQEPPKEVVAAKEPEAPKTPKSSTQFTLKPSQAKPFLDFAKTIPKADLYESVDPEWSDGAIEKEPHVTALYGLTEHDAAPVAAKIAEHGPVQLTLGKMSLFTSNPDYDVLKVDVSGKSAHALNAKLKELPHQSDFPDYKPHLTIAYLKKGVGDKYVGDTRFEGKQLGFKSLTFSPPSAMREKLGKPELPLTVSAKKVDANDSAVETEGMNAIPPPPPIPPYVEPAAETPPPAPLVAETVKTLADTRVPGETLFPLPPKGRSLSGMRDAVRKRLDALTEEFDDESEPMSDERATVVENGVKRLTALLGKIEAKMGGDNLVAGNARALEGKAKAAEALNQQQRDDATSAMNQRLAERKKLVEAANKDGWDVRRYEEPGTKKSGGISGWEITKNGERQKVRSTQSEAVNWMLAVHKLEPERERQAAEYRAEQAAKVTAESPSTKKAEQEAKRPMNMAGETRPQKPAKPPLPEYASLPQKTRDKFEAAFEKQDAVSMRELLYPNNKLTRAEFTRLTGIKLLPTVSETNEAVTKWWTDEKSKVVNAPAPVPSATVDVAAPVSTKKAENQAKREEKKVARPSLGTAGKEIWQNWKALQGTKVMPREVVVAHDIHNGGLYSWSNDTLMRDTPLQAKGETATTRPATPAEMEGLHDSLDTGGLQIESRRISGVGLAGPDSSGIPSDAGQTKKVLHQATGIPLSEWLETDTGKAWSKRMAETDAKISKANEQSLNQNPTPPASEGQPAGGVAEEGKGQDEAGGKLQEALESEKGETKPLTPKAFSKLNAYDRMMAITELRRERAPIPSYQAEQAGVMGLREEGYSKKGKFYVSDQKAPAVEAPEEPTPEPAKLSEPEKPPDKETGWNIKLAYLNNPAGPNKGTHTVWQDAKPEKGSLIIGPHGKARVLSGTKISKSNVEPSVTWKSLFDADKISARQAVTLRDLGDAVSKIVQEQHGGERRTIITLSTGERKVVQENGDLAGWSAPEEISTPATPALGVESSPVSITPNAPEPINRRTINKHWAAARAKYFTPGNIVNSYGGKDRVVSYDPGEESRWRVNVHAVDEKGNDIPGERDRSHMTEPKEKDLIPIIKDIVAGKKPLGANPVSSEQDRAYMEAVKGGDMETAQRMVDEAAKRAGFTGPVFRGDSGENVYDSPDVVHFSKNKDVAEQYDRKITRGFYLRLDEEIDARGVKLPKYLRELAREAKDLEEHEYAKKLNSDASAIELGKRSTFEPFQTDAWKMSSPSNVGVWFNGDWPGGNTDPTGDYQTLVVSFPDANRIKSADPITRDASGNVIPLSQRFNPASNSILHTNPSSNPTRLANEHTQGRLEEQGDYDPGTGKRITDEEALAEGARRLQEKPNLGSQTISDILAKQRAPADVYESAVLIHELTNRSNAFDQASLDLDEHPTAANQQRWSNAHDALIQAQHAAGFTGRATAQSLRIRQISAENDNSLGGIEARETKANEGKPVDAKTAAQGKVLWKEHAKAVKERDSALARVKELEGINTALRAHTKEGKQRPQGTGTLKTRGQAALEWLKANPAGLSTNPSALGTNPPSERSQKLAELGASLIEDGHDEPVKFANAMESLAPGALKGEDANAIFEASKQIVADDRKAALAAQTPEAVTKAIVAKREGKQAALTSADLTNLAKAILRQGVKTQPELIQAMHTELAKGFPGITPEAIAKGWTNFEKATYPSADPVDVLATDLHQQTLLSLKLDAAIKEHRLADKTGRQRQAPSTTARAQQKELMRVIKDAGLKPVDPATQLATSETRIINGLNNRLADLNRQIDNGVKDATAKSRPINNPKITGLRDEARRLSKVLDNLHSMNSPEGKRDLAIKEATTALRSYKQRIDNLTQKINTPVDGEDAIATAARVEPLKQDRADLQKEHDDLKTNLEDMVAAAHEQGVVDPLKRALDTWKKRQTKAVPKLYKTALHDLVDAHLKEAQPNFIKDATRFGAKAGMTPDDIKQIDQIVSKERERRDVMAMEALKRRKDTEITRKASVLEEMKRTGEVPAKKTPKEKKADADLQRATVQAKQLSDAIKTHVRLIELSQRPGWKKAMEETSHFFSNMAIGGYHTAAKLLGYDIAKGAELSVGEIIGGLMSLPYSPFGELMRNADHEGFGGLGEAFKAIPRGTREAWQQLTTGNSPTKTLNDNHNQEPLRWHDYIGGNLHAAEKALLLVASEAMHFEKARRAAIRDGKPFDEVEEHKRAYEYAKRDALMEQNRIATGLSRWMESWGAKDPETGKTPFWGSLLKTAAEILLTKRIMHVPMNFVAQTAERSPFGFLTGLGMWGKSALPGAAPLHPQEARLIARLIKFGLMGTAMFAYGMFDAARDKKDRMFGGYYQPGDKRHPDDVIADGIRIGGHTLPRWIAHSPLIELAQMGNTLMRVAKSRASKHADETGYLRAAVTSALGLVRKAPLIGNIPRLEDIGDPHKDLHVWNDMVSGLVPAFVANLAQDTDNRTPQGQPSMNPFGNQEVKRDPKTILDAVKAKIPGWREQVAAKSTYKLPSFMQPAKLKMAPKIPH